MLNALYPKIDWSQIDIVGFDMDGTLYDEFEFIIQGYRTIVDHFALSLIDPSLALKYMEGQWLEKGSSYDQLFLKTYEKFKVKNALLSKAQFIDQSIHILKTFHPKLILNSRNMRILNCFSEHYDLFLVTDGDSALQERKFKTLHLHEYFKKGNVVFTGRFGKGGYKPNTKSLECVELDLNKKKVLYIGDRSIDAEFAKAAGFHFLKVYNMIAT